MRLAHGVPALAIVIALLITGCGPLPASTKAGEGAAAQTVILGTAEPAGRPASDEIVEFARLVESLSDGSITVVIDWETQTSLQDFDPEDDDANVAVSSMVRESRLELAMLPDWIWMSLGAERIAAIKAPFLVTDEQVAAAIATGEVGSSMLDELSGFGVHGLALLPETIRHPVAFDRPIQLLADFEQMTMRALDPGATRLFDALGAETVELDGGAFGQGVAVGQVQGADSAFAQYASLPRTGIFTGDIGYFARMNTLVASGSWYDALDDRSRSIIDEAAAHTLEYVIATNPSDVESARLYCRAGGTIVEAGPDTVAKVRDAARPLLATYRENEVTRDTIDAISRLAEADLGSSPRIQPCSPGATGPPDEGEGEGGTFPEGSFRQEITEDAFLDAGIDAGTAHDHAGVWTLTFRDGNVYDLECPGSTYRVRDGRVSIVMGDGALACGSASGNELFSAAWTYDGSTLRFIDVQSGADGPLWQDFHEVLWGSQAWTRIG